MSYGWTEDWRAPTSSTTPINSLQAPVNAASGAAAPISMSGGGADIAGAGIGAAGQLAGTLAQVAGQRAAQDALVNSNNQNRDLSEKMARERLAASRQAFAADSQMSAYQTLAAALQQAGNTRLQSHDVNRGATKSIEQAFAEALLRG